MTINKIRAQQLTLVSNETVDINAPVIDLDSDTDILMDSVNDIVVQSQHDARIVANNLLSMKVSASEMNFNSSSIGITSPSIIFNGNLTINGALNLNNDGIEGLQDIIGEMMSGNVENGISVTYSDAGHGTGKINFDVNDFTIALGGDLTGSININNLVGGTLNAQLISNSVGPNELDLTDDYDFSASGSVKVRNPVDDSDAASKYYVDQQILTTGGTKKQIVHKITYAELQNGYFELTDIPKEAKSVALNVVGGPKQVNKKTVGATGTLPDFDVINDVQIHISNNGAANGLTEKFSVDDIVIVEFIVG